METMQEGRDDDEVDVDEAAATTQHVDEGVDDCAADDNGAKPAGLAFFGGGDWITVEGPSGDDDATVIVVVDVVSIVVVNVAVAAVVTIDDVVVVAVAVVGDTDMAPTAADLRTAMTDSRREPAGPAPLVGVFGVRGGRGAAV